jgi:hypothetical protein
MSFLTRVILEAERESVVDFVHALDRDEGLRAVLREQGLRAATQAAARASLARKEPVPVRQEPMRRGHVHGDRLEPRINSAGRFDRPNNRPNGPGEAGPVRTGSGVAGTHHPEGRGGSSTRVGGDLITPGRPDVTAIGRARPTTKPMQTGKSKIVPEPDQIQSPPPGRRRSSLLEPPGY